MSAKEEYRSFKVKYRPYITAAVLAWIMTLFIRPIMADGVAMQPTIQDNQVIIVTNHKYTSKRGAPEYGQVVAFRKDFVAEGDKGDNTIRRVIGLPGDKIEIKNGKVYRNGSVVKESYIKGKTPGDMASVKVGKEEVFVLGDNRSDSIDSRDERVGPLDMSLIRGNCALVIWPLSDFGFVD